MSDPTGYELKIGDTKFGLDIDKDDLLAVGIANYEQGKLARKKELTTEIREVNSRKEDLVKAVGAAERVLVADIKDKHVQSFLRAGKRLQVNMVVENSHRIDEDGNIEGRRVIAVVVPEQRHGFGGHRNHVASVSATIEPTEEILELREKAKEAKEQVATLGRELSEVVQALNSLSTKEREVRAHLVVKSLQTTDEGKALLAALTEGEDNPFMLTDTKGGE